MNCSTGSCLNVKRRTETWFFLCLPKEVGSENLLLVGTREKFLYLGSMQEPKRKGSQSGVLWKQDKDTFPALKHQLCPQCVHGSHSGLNVKHTGVSRRLLTDQLCLPVLHSVFKGKPCFFPSFPLDFKYKGLQHKPRVRPLQHLLTGRDWMHRSWCFPLYYITHNTDMLLY